MDTGVVVDGPDKVSVRHISGADLLGSQAINLISSALTAFIAPYAMRLILYAFGS